MNILLTGAAGKVGSVVCRHLVTTGHTVRATDKSYCVDLPVRTQVADLLQPDQAYRLLDGVEAVVHLANHPYFRGSDSQRIFNENITMNMNLFQAASETGVRKIVFSSSIQVVSGKPGELPPYLPLDSDSPANPGNPYALSKRVSETMLDYFAKRAAVDAVAIRFPWIVDEATAAGIQSKEHWSTTNFHEGLSFLHVRDAARLIIATLTAPLPGFRVYLVAAKGNGLRQPAAEVIRKHYPGIPLRRPLEQIDALVDVTRVTVETGWTPTINEL